MTLIQELEQLIARTGSYQDRELLKRVLAQLNKNGTASSWAYHEEKKIVRR